MTSGNEGVAEQARRLGAACLKTAAHRLELLSLELQEEKIRVLQLLVLAVAACVSAFTAMLVLIGLIFWVLPAGWRTPFLVLVVASCAGVAWFSYRGLNARLRSAGFFAATRAEMSKDRECLETKS